MMCMPVLHEALVGSILDELIARAVPRPLPAPKVSRLGVKATTLKAKAKAKDLAFEAKAKAKDLAFKAKAKAKDDVKANVNMVRCSVKTSKHRRLLQGW